MECIDKKLVIDKIESHIKNLDKMVQEGRCSENTMRIYKLGEQHILDVVKLAVSVDISDDIIQKCIFQNAIRELEEKASKDVQNITSPDSDNIQD